MFCHCVATQVRRGVPVLTVRRGIQTAAFLGPVAALMALANPAISPPLALLSMTAALGITSLGEQARRSKHTSHVLLGISGVADALGRGVPGWASSYSELHADSNSHSSCCFAGQAGFVANMSDIAPRHAGLLFGLCNTFGSFAGILGVSGVAQGGCWAEGANSGLLKLQPA